MALGILKAAQGSSPFRTSGRTHPLRRYGFLGVGTVLICARDAACRSWMLARSMAKLSHVDRDEERIFMFIGEILLEILLALLG